LLFIFTSEVDANDSLKFNLIFVTQRLFSLIMFLVLINLRENILWWIKFVTLTTKVGALDP